MPELTSAERATRRALVSASHRWRAGAWRDDRAPGKVLTLYGRTVCRARIHAPYGRSSRLSSYLTHIPREVYVAFAAGRVVGGLVRWRCGGTSAHFHLIDEVYGELCFACKASLIKEVNRT